MDRRNPSVYLLAIIAGITAGLCAFLLSPGSGQTNLHVEDLAFNTQQISEPDEARAVGEPSGAGTSDLPPEALADVGTGNTISAPNTATAPAGDQNNSILAAPAEEGSEAIDACLLYTSPSPRD